MLYDRDNKILTEEEKIVWQKVEETFKKSIAENNNIITLTASLKYYQDIPVAALHYKQLFPNNYLNTGDLENKQMLMETVDEFKSLLNSSSTERDILNFIRDRKA